MMRHCRLPVCMLATLFVFFILYEFLDLVWVRDSSEMVIKDKTAKLANQLQARMQRSNILEYELILAESSDIVTRSRFQRAQVDKYCEAGEFSTQNLEWPTEKQQRDTLHNHLVFDDATKSIFCFVEGIGSVNMQHLMSTSTTRGITFGNFLTATLTNKDKQERLEKYFKFAFVTNPLERLVSSYIEMIQPPLLNAFSSESPDIIKREIFEKYRPLVYNQWLETGSNFNVSITFSEYVDYYIDSFKEHLHPRIKPFTLLCHPCSIHYSFYGNLDNFTEDASLVLDKLVKGNKLHKHSSLQFATDGTLSLKDLRYYYGRLTLMQRAKLYDIMRSELLFYYYLYPYHRHAHTQILGIEERLYKMER